MKKNLLRRSIICGIIILFVGASVLPSISGNIGKISSFKDAGKEITDDDSRTSGQTSSSLSKITIQDSASLTFYTFDGPGMQKQDVVLPSDDATNVYDMFEELRYEITHHPVCEETQTLKQEFVDMLDANGLIPGGLSKTYILSLLNPLWFQWINNDDAASNEFSSSANMLSSTAAANSQFNQLQTYNSQKPVKYTYGSSSTTGITGKTEINRDNANLSIKNVEKIYDRFERQNNGLLSTPYGERASALFCSMTSGGSGLVFPPILLPRPRIVMVWRGYPTTTSVAELSTGNGFVATGDQQGLAVGFLGIGIMFALPGVPAFYGFVGYALFTTVDAESIEYYPPNSPPVISNENPQNGARYVPASTSELSFRVTIGRR